MPWSGPFSWSAAITREPGTHGCQRLHFVIPLLLGALLAYYGSDAIFIDIDSFRQEIQEAITKNDLVLAPQGSA